MITLLVHLDGKTWQASAIDPAWLQPGARELFWLDIEGPQDDERQILEQVLHVHELIVEDALAEIHHPKIERYDNVLYLILHGIVGDARKGRTGFVTQDVDFIVGRNYLVTVHHDKSRSIEAERTVCMRHPDLFADGPLGLCHRIVDQMVDHYRPEIDGLEERAERLERAVFNARKNPIRDLLALKHDISSLRRVALPQRDAIGRLSRREFPEITDRLAFKFRDVFDHLVRLTDEASFLQDRVTGLIDAHLSTQSNRLNQVMKVLTVIATIFMPLTVLTGMFGMNVTLPHLPGGGAAQFWWIFAIMTVLSGVMLWFFRRQRWL